jgi:hypothetical protein
MNLEIASVNEENSVKNEQTMEKKVQNWVKNLRIGLIPIVMK